MRTSSCGLQSISICDMAVVRSSFLIVACLLFSTPIAFGAGGIDGGGGGGNMVPSADRGGSSLSQIFREGVAFLTDGDCMHSLHLHPTSPPFALAFPGQFP